MDNNARAPQPSRPKRTPGAPRGNQNARRHGRYSKLKPADRYAPLQKMLQSYGLKDHFASESLSVEELLEDPKTNVRLLYLLLQAIIELVRIKEILARS